MKAQHVERKFGPIIYYSVGDASAIDVFGLTVYLRLGKAVAIFGIRVWG